MSLDEVELQAWWFVNKFWPKQKRMPVPDKGFEDSFRKYLHKTITFDFTSDHRDMKMGLSLTSLSGNPHELDFVGGRRNGLHIFELKHYNVLEISKEIVFTFLGKVMDFSFNNPFLLEGYKINTYLVTVNNRVDDQIRKLCITYGIKLIDTSQISLGVLERFLRELHSQVPETNQSLKAEAAKMVEEISSLRDSHDYSFSDIFRIKESHVQMDLPPPAGPSDSVAILKKVNASFRKAHREWKSSRG